MPSAYPLPCLYTGPLSYMPGLQPSSSTLIVTRPLAHLSPSGQVSPTRRAPKPSGRRHADHWPTLQVYTTLNILSLHVTHRARFLSGLDYVPVGNGLLHRTNQALFVRLLAFLFVSDLPPSIPQLRLIPLAFTIIHRRTSLTLIVYAPAVAHSLRFCQFSSFRSPYSPRHRRRATACASPSPSRFHFPPLLDLHVTYLSRT